jgi:plasmid stabilization system protein ParE
MSRQVRITLRARRWFNQRVAEIAAVNPHAAEKLIRRLEDMQRLLSGFPDMTERGQRKGTRKISLPPYILMSRRVGDDLEIFAIRHARQRDALAPAETEEAED